MRVSCIALIVVAIAVALLVGCNGPVWLPQQYPRGLFYGPGYYHWYYQPHFKMVPTPPALYGYGAPETGLIPFRLQPEGQQALLEGDWK